MDIPKYLNLSNNFVNIKKFGNLFDFFILYPPSKYFDKYQLNFLYKKLAKRHNTTISEIVLFVNINNL